MSKRAKLEDTNDKSIWMPSMINSPKPTWASLDSMLLRNGDDDIDAISPQRSSSCTSIVAQSFSILYKFYQQIHVNESLAVSVEADRAAAQIRSSRQTSLFIDYCLETLRVACRDVAEESFWAELLPIKESFHEAEKLGDVFCHVLQQCRHRLFTLFNALTVVHRLLARRRSATDSPSAYDCAQGNRIPNIAQCKQRFQYIIHAVFFSSVPSWFHSLTMSFFDRQMTSFCIARKHHANARAEADVTMEDIDMSNEDECNNTSSQTNLERALFECTRFIDCVCPILRELNWIDVFETSFSSMLFKRIDQRIQRVAATHFEIPVFERLERWLDNTIIPWLHHMLFESHCQRFNEWTSRLRSYLYERFGEQRIAELFDIIVDFPDSLAAVNDISLCLAKTSLRSNLIRSLRAAIKKRLLHPGAMTRDILSQYVSCVRVFRVLDSCGSLVHAVVSPIRSYLRQRPDTVRTIVSALLDDSPIDLLSELEAVAAEKTKDGPGSARFDNEETTVYEEDSDIENFENDEHEWMPEPTEVDSGSWWLRRGEDVIGQLVFIFGHANRFAEEYRSLLAERLLSATSYECDHEIRHLELLKLRFGESIFHYCDVMLNDIGMSKRIDANIHMQMMTGASNDNTSIISHRIDNHDDDDDDDDDDDKRFSCTPPGAQNCFQNIIFHAENIHVTLISAQFWPYICDENMRFPHVFRSVIQSYSRSYEVMKAPRELRWKATLGSVDVCITFDDGRSISLDALPPISAAILLFFASSNGPLSLLQIAEHIDVEIDAVKRKLSYWVNRQILCITHYCSGNEQHSTVPVYSVIENLAAYRAANTDTVMFTHDTVIEKEHEICHDEDESSVLSMVSEQAQQAKILESYILGILPSTFGGFTLKRVHNILRGSFSSGTMTFTRSEAELELLLDALVQRGKLECVDGLLYKQRRSRRINDDDDNNDERE